jgi:hypothetical protein
VHPRIACLIALLAATPALAADPPPAGGVADLTGARALGVSAAIGTASGNDSIFLNPGAIAARRRYTAETSIFVERRGSDSVAQLIGGTVVDSQTAGLAAGFSYQRAREGIYTGNLLHLAFAGPVADRFFLGVSGKYLSLDGPPLVAGEPDDEVSAVTVDAGFLFQVAEYVSLGAAGYNLIPIRHEGIAPRGAGAGLDVGSDRIAHVTVDWRTDLDRDPERSTNRWSAGVEVLLGGLMPLRAGYVWDETLDTQWWSAGAGLVTRGLAIDVGYRQSLDASSARTLAASVKLNLFD